MNSAVRHHLLHFCFLLCLMSPAAAHLVPSTEIEAHFDSAQSCELRINLDPRAFLAQDPTSLPPVPGSWFQNQTAAQVAATQKSCRDYLTQNITPLLDGQKHKLTTLTIQPIDGADNNPLRPDTAELHFLALAKLKIPPSASRFQIDYAKTAKTDLILYHTSATGSDRRFQAIFPGETSRVYPLAVPPATLPDTSLAITTPSQKPNLVPIYLLMVFALFLLIGWLLLRKYRHHHRAHRKPLSAEDQHTA